MGSFASAGEGEPMKNRQFLYTFLMQTLMGLAYFRSIWKHVTDKQKKITIHNEVEQVT